MDSTSSCMGGCTCGLKQDVQRRVGKKLPSLVIVMQALLVLANSGCDDWIKEWREERAASRKEEADRLKPDYIPPECRHPFGLYRVFAEVVWNYPACAQQLALTFSSDTVVWWGGTNTFGPDHKATRIRKQGCEFEYTEPRFVGTETREWSTGKHQGRPVITYEGTWTFPVRAWGVKCVAQGLERFIREANP